jgi:glycosyltransferase involved in cell wall biosynthesis
MRILFLAPQPFFRERGTPLRARNILTALSEAGHEIDVLCYPFGADIALPRVRIFRSPRVPGVRDVRIGPSLAKIPLDGLMALNAWALARRGRYDVIQAVEEAGFFAAPLARWFGARLVYDMDSYISEQLVFSGFAPRGPVLWIARALERRTMRASSLVITVGPTHAREVERLAPGVRTLELFDAPLNAAFAEDSAGAARLRRELGLGDARCVVYTGNFEPYQGVDLLVRASGLLAREYPGARIVLAGGEPAQIEDMRKQAAESGGGSICVFAGKRPPEEMAAFMSLASALVTPRCRGANPPMKIYGYLQSGRPVVATRVPTHLQVLDDSCAILVEPDPADIARGLGVALGDPDRSAALTRAARARLEDRFSLRCFKDRVRSAFAGLDPARPPA